MMQDDRFDEVLRDAARDYNEPREVPRDLMWQRIQAARTEARTAEKVVPLRRRTPRAWAVWPAALAAMLLIGIGIGRLSRVQNATQTPVAVNTQQQLPQQQPQATPATPATASAPRAAVPGPRVEQRNVQQQPQAQSQLASNTAPRVTSPAPSEPNASANDLPYRFAALQHLTRAEALLTTYEVDTKAGRTDEQTQALTKDMLANTRLLLDSPAGQDPRLRPLLEDLELVLVQIRQATSATTDREMVVEGMERREMLPRIRTAIPGALVQSGT